VSSIKNWEIRDKGDIWAGIIITISVLKVIKEIIDKVQKFLKNTGSRSVDNIGMIIFNIFVLIGGLKYQIRMIVLL